MLDEWKKKIKSSNSCSTSIKGAKNYSKSITDAKYPQCKIYNQGNSNKFFEYFHFLSENFIWNTLHPKTKYN